MNSETIDIVMSESSQAPERVPPPPGALRGAFPFWCIWPNRSRPQRIVLCTRDVVPQIPPQHVANPRDCVDGRLGLLEAGHLPQFHVPGQWHLALIPLASPAAHVPIESGRPWWYLQHTDPSGDLSSFRLTDDDLAFAGPGVARLPISLRQRLVMTVDELKLRMKRLEGVRSAGARIMRSVAESFRDLETITDVLRNQKLQRWEVRQVFSLWQRYVNEVKGWLVYDTIVGENPWGDTPPNPLGSDALWDDLALAALRDRADRNAEVACSTTLIRHSRGVFVLNEIEAYAYAEHDVPVWYILPYTESLATTLAEKQRAGLIRRAFYRKYGSEQCAYMEAVEQRFYMTTLGPSKCLALSRSRQAYAQLHSDEIDVVDHPDDPVPGPSSRPLADQSTFAPHPAASPASSDPRLRAFASLPPKPFTPQPVASGMAALPPKPLVSQPWANTVSTNVLQFGPLPLTPSGSGKAKKRKARETEESAGRPHRTRRTTKTLIRQEAAPMNVKVSDVQLNTSDPSLFKTTDRPVWFPAVFPPAEDSLSLIDMSRPRQLCLGALQNLAVPKAVVAKGRLHKVPLVSYFVNVWHETRSEGYGLKRGKHGVIEEGRLQEVKSPESVLSKMFIVWAKLRALYLRKLAMSAAMDIPGFPPPIWRKTVKLVLPIKDTPRVITDMGIDVAFLISEPEIVSAADAEDEEPFDGPDRFIFDHPADSAPRIEPASLVPAPPISLAAAAPGPSVPLRPSSVLALPVEYKTAQINIDYYSDSDPEDRGEDDGLGEHGMLSLHQEAPPASEVSGLHPKTQTLFDSPAERELPPRGEEERAAVEPADWWVMRATGRHQSLTAFDHYISSYKNGVWSFLMTSSKANTFGTAVEGDAQWWDYENWRILYLPESTKGLVGEHLINEFVFKKKYASRQNERPTRRIWPADWDGTWRRSGYPIPGSKPPAPQQTASGGRAALLASTSAPTPAFAAPEATSTAVRALVAPVSAPSSSVSALVAPGSAPSTPVSALVAPVSAPGPGVSEASSAPQSRPIPKTIGEVFDQLPHPSHDDHVLPPYQHTEDEDGGWPSVAWRKYWLWELREIEFRHELLALDLTLRQAHPELEQLQRIAPEQRFFDCKSCWGGSDFTPGCDWTENELGQQDPRRRLRALARFVSFMSVWPRVQEFLGPWETISDPAALDRVDTDSEVFLALERSAWCCFAQTFYDYKHRNPPVPYLRPPLPV
ncbi:hypothetical protein AURDEDRAFT_173187 [Auricularia subglabra TFB-10046 SS5]|nr:hypothetical protein AURDEDRAFT_173187 [Auricularia subglabra TFB-10046 SS5]